MHLLTEKKLAVPDRSRGYMGQERGWCNCTTVTGSLGAEC
jgi:hypothetical protein